MAHVLFANTPLLRTCIGGLCPSLTFLQLGTYVQAHGHRATNYDLAGRLDLKEHSMDEIVARMAAEIIATAPDVLGLSSKVPADGRFMRDLVPMVKAALPEVLVIVGGIWATPCHVELLDEVTGVDVVVLGEGETALLTLLDRFDAGLTVLSDEVPGIAYRGAAGVIETAAGVPVCSRSRPPLDLSLLANPGRYTVFPFLTSHGCPYRCTFCSEAVIYPDYKETPLNRLRDDLRALDEAGHDWFLWMSDPLFGASTKRLETVCAAIEETRFDFLMESRVDVLKPEHLPSLWRAGCELIYFGLESGACDTLKRINKVKSDRACARYLRQAKALMAACMENNITPVFGVLNPTPGDRIVDLQATYTFLSELAQVAKETCQRTGMDPGYHFYAFNYRFIRGTTDTANLDEMAARGATWLQDPADVFTDLLIHDASPEIPRALALEFQRKVAGLVHNTPTGWQRLQRSFPSQPAAGLG